MEPREVVRLALLVNFGALALVVAVWMLGFGAGGASNPAGSPFGVLVLLAGVGLLAIAAFLLGGAGLDAVWARVQRLRGGGK